MQESVCWSQFLMHRHNAKYQINSSFRWWTLLFHKRPKVAKHMLKPCSVPDRLSHHIIIIVIVVTVIFSTHILMWIPLFLQLRNGCEIKLEPLSDSLFLSVTAAPTQASITSVTTTSGSINVCRDDQLSPRTSDVISCNPTQQQATSSHQERALRYLSMTQSRDPGNSETEPNFSPLPPTSSAGLRQQEESVRWHPQEEEEGDKGQQQGGAIEKTSFKGKSCSPNIQQHPQHCWRRGESNPLTSWSGKDGDSQGRGEKGGRGLHPQEASFKQEQDRSYSQTGISGRRLYWQKNQKYAGKWMSVIIFIV